MFAPQRTKLSMRRLLPLQPYAERRLSSPMAVDPRPSRMKDHDPGSGVVELW